MYIFLVFYCSSLQLAPTYLCNFSPSMYRVLAEEKGSDDEEEGKSGSKSKSGSGSKSKSGSGSGDGSKSGDGKKKKINLHVALNTGDTVCFSRVIGWVSDVCLLFLP
jgi:hypothetical protein